MSFSRIIVNIGLNLGKIFINHNGMGTHGFLAFGSWDGKEKRKEKGEKMNKEVNLIASGFKPRTCQAEDHGPEATGVLLNTQICTLVP